MALFVSTVYYMFVVLFVAGFAVVESNVRQQSRLSAGGGRHRLARRSRDALRLRRLARGQQVQLS